MSSAALASVTKSNPLWDFATWAYAEPGVEKACLALQNRLGVDVNMLMFCAWLAYRGSGTAHLAKSLGAALKLSREWQRTLVEPLRSARENLKDVIEASGLMGNDRNTAMELRERIKQCEVDMEQLQTLAFYSLVAGGTEDHVATRSPAEQKDDALNNLTVYFAATGVKLDALGQTHVMRILTAVFGS